MAIAVIFQNNEISMGRNLAKILKIFENIDEARGYLRDLANLCHNTQVSDD
jgi:hypothetical protein